VKHLGKNYLLYIAKFYTLAALYRYRLNKRAKLQRINYSVAYCDPKEKLAMSQNDHRGTLKMYQDVIESPESLQST
jgi:hypothetical protein